MECQAQEAALHADLKRACEQLEEAKLVAIAAKTCRTLLGGSASDAAKEGGQLAGEYFGEQGGSTPQEAAEIAISYTVEFGGSTEDAASAGGTAQRAGSSTRIAIRVTRSAGRVRRTLGRFKCGPIDFLTVKEGEMGGAYGPALFLPGPTGEEERGSGVGGRVLQVTQLVDGSFSVVSPTNFEMDASFYRLV